ncbi:outer membrane beta-barrel protein [Flavivirga algicola]|uniref:Porin family protein n=1 Tax=Flavivirga algicola TaxID=2729136 RepID=A0ABX1S1V1_9FLAO|nr:outer membrane beta-barrel protein [Flavivirga algicola]NMH88863.1 porin family protein [Flavivirga algicola]
MISISHIKTSFFCALLFVSLFSFAQVTETSESKNNSKQDFKETKQKLGFGSINFNVPIPSGDNFIGLGTKSKIGFDIKALFFIHKQFFVSGSVGTNYFKVIDQSIIGNYNKTEAQHQYLSIGYEVLALPKMRLGLSVSVYGESFYRNTHFTNNRKAYQRDSGRVRNYNIYFDYMLSDEFAVCLNYNYRNDKMNIRTSPDIQNIFDNARFHSIGLGVKLYFGNADVISGI